MKLKRRKLTWFELVLGLTLVGLIQFSEAAYSRPRQCVNQIPMFDWKDNDPYKGPTNFRLECIQWEDVREPTDRERTRQSGENRDNRNPHRGPNPRQ